MEILSLPSFKIAANLKGDPKASKVAILMPGRLDTKDYVNFVSHAERLAELGFFVAAIDPPCTWDSPGDINEYTTTSYLKVIDELIEYFGKRPTLLLGHSRGGATAMLASKNPATAALVVVNSSYGAPTPPEPEKLENGLLSEQRDLPPGDVRSAEPRQFYLPMVYFEDGVKHNPREALEKFNGPKLIVHGTGDPFVALDKVKEIYAGLREPKMFLEIESEHDYRLFPKAIRAVNDALGEFVGEYLQS